MQCNFINTKKILLIRKLFSTKLCQKMFQPPFLFTNNDLSFNFI